MVYFDNAATSRKKPTTVIQAFADYISDVGASPGRGSYTLGIQASRMLYQSRKTVTSYFGCPSKTNVVFTKNSTEAINLFFNGYLKSGDHVLISPYEHNAVLRPLHVLQQIRGIEYSVLSESALRDPDEFTQFLMPNTKVVAITLASNLTGEIIYKNWMGKTCTDNNIAMFVDASQGGGKKLVNMDADHVDYLAFTGHKDLMGLPGAGGLCSKAELSFQPLIQGGTGIHGEQYTNPQIYPDAYESGTLNMPAIWALKAAIEYITENHDLINMKESALTKYLVNRIQQLDNVELIKPDVLRVPTLCFNIKGKASSDVVAFLDKKGICVRGGIHCAILAHQTLNTVATGAVRVSLNYQNTTKEIDQLIDAIREME